MPIEYFKASRHANKPVRIKDESLDRNAAEMRLRTGKDVYTEHQTDARALARAVGLVGAAHRLGGYQHYSTAVPGMGRIFFGDPR